VVFCISGDLINKIRLFTFQPIDGLEILILPIGYDLLCRHAANVSGLCLLTAQL
jgi:hypothetical protein